MRGPQLLIEEPTEQPTITKQFLATAAVWPIQASTTWGGCCNISPVSRLVRMGPVAIGSTEADPRELPVDHIGMGVLAPDRVAILRRGGRTIQSHGEHGTASESFHQPLPRLYFPNQGDTRDGIRPASERHRRAQSALAFPSAAASGSARQRRSTGYGVLKT